jgi:hypothetical protein
MKANPSLEDVMPKQPTARTAPKLPYSAPKDIPSAGGAGGGGVGGLWGASKPDFGKIAGDLSKRMARGGVARPEAQKRERPSSKPSISKRISRGRY